MPKKTYFNLGDEKKTKVYETLKKNFEEKAIKDVTVKDIVDELGIPRGSFYQYFDSIKEAYFYVLENELVEIHEGFIKLVRENGMDVILALDLFGEIAADEIFNDKNYKLYRSRYLYMNPQLEKQWNAYKGKNTQYAKDILSIAESEKIAFIGAIMHSLIKRLFSEAWDRNEFIEHFNLHLKWIKGGIEK